MPTLRSRRNKKLFGWGGVAIMGRKFYGLRRAANVWRGSWYCCGSIILRARLQDDFLNIISNLIPDVRVKDIFCIIVPRTHADLCVCDWLCMNRKAV